MTAKQSASSRNNLMRQNTLLTMLYAEYQNTDMQNMSICYDIIYVYSDHLVQSAHIGGGSRKEKKS